MQLRYVSRRGRWRTLDADYYPALSGTDARAAAELVVEGARLTLDSGRRSGFAASLGGMVGTVKPARSTRMIFEHLAAHEQPDDCVYVTTAPAEHADRIAAGFGAIDARRPQ
jgi:hypothetical protein